jgi:D-lactate dehydrogenase (cytochrome)
MQRILEAASASNLVEDAVIAASHAQRLAFWKLRESISDAQKPEGGSIKHDVSLPLSVIPAFLKDAALAVSAIVPDARIVSFGHLGDGNIHYNISQPATGNKKAFLDRWLDVNAAVHAVVHRYQGSISAEHGLGQAKIDEITKYKSHTELDMMRAIKRALDPNNIMNPGKVIRV